MFFFCSVPYAYDVNITVIVAISNTAFLHEVFYSRNRMHLKPTHLFKTFSAFFLLDNQNICCYARTTSKAKTSDTNRWSQLIMTNNKSTYAHFSFNVKVIYTQNKIKGSVITSWDVDGGCGKFPLGEKVFGANVDDLVVESRWFVQ